MFCEKCGCEINDNLIKCPECGADTNNGAMEVLGAPGDDKNWVVTYFLCFIFGSFGVHRFYTGYRAIGILQLLTLGGCGIWALIDFIALTFNAYKTKDDEKLGGYIEALAVCGMIVFIVRGLYQMFSILKDVYDVIHKVS